ncbi:hypothetical protein Desca_1590 [Desulfotomaculum nigrificans CO-1-SRB]|uniref:Polyprenyl synthetase n=1 Tax=Desulfotomaculum nigrificans (strain DSM 14880 / VKM B-2319 / CO-1-SRB) TaxID=868595 RepID=F6B718_DESCC|nr:polyprenyl synthetase family protein [Desulfotomaculum nigrificans]AEF94443.1 hypothetical protein Desca_1590 [Desulfotomaculum nigrificans CO-1-SRB]
MSGDNFAVIKKELQSVHDIIRNQLIIKAGHVGQYAHLEFCPTDNFIRPALVLTVARLYNCMSPKVISLGAIVQFIFMASQIHARIPETADNNRDPRDGTQFPVLVGDYLFGKFFTTLCDNGIVHYLRPLAEIIGRLNEGGILSKTNPNAITENESLFEEIVKLEVAELMAGSARLAGDLAGAPEEDKSLLHEFGLSLGMVYGLTQRNFGHQQIQKYFDRAMQALKGLPNRLEKDLLEKLIHSLRTPDGFSIRKVV